MHVLLLDDDHDRHEDIMTAFLKAGYQITATSSLKVAEAILMYGYVDLLVATETLRDRLTHTTALFAEHRNPTVSTIMISDRSGTDVEELYELIPSVHCIVGSDISGKVILELGRASVVSQARTVSFSQIRAAAPASEAGFAAAA